MLCASKCMECGVIILLILNAYSFWRSSSSPRSLSEKRYVLKNVTSVNDADVIRKYF